MSKILNLLTLLTKFLHNLPTELSHNLALKSLKILSFIGFRIKKKGNLDERNFLNFKVPNKLGLAAGLDKNGDYIDSLSSLGFGFLEIGTVTPKPQPGNLKPRLFRIKSEKALINKMGFNNKGVDHLVFNLKKKKTKIPIGVSIGKNFDTPNESAHEDYIFCLDRAYEYADYFAINISSPNTKGLRDLETKQEIGSLLLTIKKRQIYLADNYGYKPLLLKISPDNNEESLKSICEAIKRNSIDGLICSNTTTDHNHISGLGGLSGEPLMGPSTETLRIARKFLGDQFPIIASGGVMSKEDYLQKIYAGADLVQIYTGFIYEGPKLILDILNK